METPMSELGPAARAVVEAGRAGDDPTPHDRSRVRAALMTALAASSAGAAAVAGEGAAAAGVAKGVATAVTLGWGWKAFLLGLGVACVVGTGVVVTSAARPVAAPTPNPVVAPPETSSARGAPPKIAGAEPSIVVLPIETTPPPGSRVTPVVAAPAPHRAAPPRAAEPTTEPEPAPPAPPAAAAPAAPAAVDPLEAETRGLGAAHGALKDGDPAKALALLDAQSTAYADGQLREERAAARILALCKLGRADEARALAARFLADNPRSPLADRVRGACAASDPR